MDIRNALNTSSSPPTQGTYGVQATQIFFADEVSVGVRMPRRLLDEKYLDHPPLLSGLCLSLLLTRSVVLARSLCVTLSFGGTCSRAVGTAVGTCHVVARSSQSGSCGA